MSWWIILFHPLSNVGYQDRLDSLVFGSQCFHFAYTDKAYIYSIKIMHDVEELGMYAYGKGSKEG